MGSIANATGSTSTHRQRAGPGRADVGDLIYPTLHMRQIRALISDHTSTHKISFDDLSCGEKLILFGVDMHVWIT